MSDTTGARYDLEKLNVLVVEDSEFTRHLVESILRALRVKNIRASADGAEALDILNHATIDMAIVDWVMEPLDGLDFVRHMRTAKDSPNPYLPIIMLTGHTEAWRVRQARDEGVNEFLAKPVSAKALYQRIISIIDYPRPFVRATSYFGPDRRRKDDGPPFGTAERRGATQAA